jgi:alkanesulfonate monooxygenase SsuD/methylene tetrahydromethanopterin reductase-like flavin-dependent oxidoreductase (luciferase family)
VFGAGRGSVEREARVFGVDFGRGGDDGDRRNRELFEEQMEIIRLAWEQPEFSYHGKHYTIPPAGILNTGNPLTGRPWDKISLVPQPRRPIPIYQACNSDDTLRMCAKAGNVGVLAFASGLAKTKDKWRRYGELLSEYHGRTFGPGEKRMLVVSVHLGEDRQSAIEELRAPIAERGRFLSQQRPVGNAPDGTPYPVAFVPTLEQTLERGGMLVGSVAEVRDRLVDIVETLEADEIAVEMGFPGMLEDVVARQIKLFAEGVRPALERARKRSAVPVAAD